MTMPSEYMTLIKIVFRTMLKQGAMARRAWFGIGSLERHVSPGT